MYACMHVCMYACVHVCMYACMHVCMHASMHLCIYASMHLSIYLWLAGHLRTQIRVICAHGTGSSAHTYQVHLRTHFRFICAHIVASNNGLHSTSLFKLPPLAFHPTIVSIRLLYLNFPPPAFHPIIVSIRLLYLNFPPLRSTQPLSPFGFFI